MQRLQDAARHGYAFYVTGETSEEKWPALAAKFSEIYLCALPKSTRSKRRKSGEAVTMLYAYQDPYKSASGAIVWALMVTDGRGRVHARETLLQLTKDRFVLGGYELVHDGVGWSWKMTRERVDYWREKIHTIAAMRPKMRVIETGAYGKVDQDIEKVMDVLYNAPGFRLVRRQVGMLVHFARGEWARLRPNSTVQIRTRTFLPYVGRLSNKALTGGG